MNNSKMARCVRRIIVAGIAIYATGQAWEGMDTLSEGFRRLEDAHAEGLNLGMQLIIMLFILYLCLIAAKNILEIVMILKMPAEGQSADAGGKRCMEIMEKARIILSLVPVLLIFILLMAIGVYGMYMASIGRAGSEMYAIGVFFIVVAAWGFVSTIRKIIRLLKDRQSTNE